jgi:hypothetical protein
MRLPLMLLALGACAEPAIEMSLKLPPTVPAGFDVSCVTAIDVLAVGEFQGDEDTPPDLEGDCIDVAGMSSFDDIRRAMAGQFTIDIPDSGLVGLSVRGSTGTCADIPAYHEAVFYGGAPATGDSVQIPVVPNLSCNMRGKVLPVHPVDLLALSSTKTCPVTTDGRAFSANFRPLLLGDQLPTMTFEYGSSASSQWTGGTTRVEVFSQAASAQTCVGVGYGSPSEIGGGRCVEDQPALCAAPGELELPIIAFDYMFQSRDVNLVAQYGEPVLGAVWETGTKLPVAGATVTLEDPTQGTVVYVEKGTTKFTPKPGATSTPADGFFMVYLKGPPTNITVTSPLHNALPYKVATTPDYPTTLIAALTRR